MKITDNKDELKIRKISILFLLLFSFFPVMGDFTVNGFILCGVTFISLNVSVLIFSALALKYPLFKKFAWIMIIILIVGFGPSFAIDKLTMLSAPIRGILHLICMNVTVAAAIVFIARIFNVVFKQTL